VFLNFYKCIYKANERCNNDVLLHALVARIFGTHTAITAGTSFCCGVQLKAVLSDKTYNY